VVEVALHKAAKDRTFRERAVIVRIPEDSTAITRYCDLLREVLAVLDPDAPVPPPPDRQSRIAELLDDRVVILAIENLDRVFHDIGLEGQRNLRAWVETSRQVLLLTTTPTLFAGVTDRSKPWYGGLATLMLPALTAEEGQELVALLADARGDQELSAFVRSDTGRSRIKAVAQLTGGSPRAWMVLASVATKESLDELVPAVEELLESMVPYYQQLLWSLSPNERRLVVALAQTGRMTVKQVAEAAEIEPQSAATTLRRLTEERWVQAEQPRSGDRRVTHYGVREPLLRCHLQYRQESSQPIGLVVMILKGFFSDRERASTFVDGGPGPLGEKHLPASLAASTEGLPEGEVSFLLQLVAACAGDDPINDIHGIWARATGTSNPHILQLIGENLAAAHGEARDFPGAFKALDAAADRIRDLVGVDHEAFLRIRGEVAYWTGEAGDPTRALTLYTELLPDRLRILGPDHPDTLTTLNAIADRASDFSDIKPVAAVVEESKNAQVVSTLVLAAWRLGGAGPAPESPPTEGWLGSLLFTTARAAAGHEQDRSDLPPEVLSILDSIDGDPS
jgi:DNA-binding MarR family transcriptional regulator